MSNWIQKMHMKNGALHSDLGVSQGEKIPVSKLKIASKSGNPTIKKRAILAKTLKNLNK